MPGDFPSVILPDFRCGHDWAWMKVSTIGEILAIKGRELVYQRAAYCDDAALVNYLLGCGLSAVLQQRVGLVLAGSAVVRNGLAYLLLGRGAVGKSTLSARLVQSGCSLLSDEIVHVRLDESGKLVALPGLSTIKLWPESMAWVQRWWGETFQMRRGHEKLVCDAAGHQYSKPAPIAGIWHLKHDRSPALTTCELRGKDRLQALSACSSALIQPSCSRDMAPRFALLAMLANVEGFEELRRNIKLVSLEATHKMVSSKIAGD